MASTRASTFLLPALAAALVLLAAFRGSSSLGSAVSTAKAQVSMRPIVSYRRAAMPRASLCVSAQTGEQSFPSRRTTLGGLAAATIAAPLSAKAGLFGPGQREVYEKETGEFLEELKATLAIPANDDAKKDAVLALKTSGNRWVAKWRNSKMSSTPSFGNLYSVVNAVNGHYNTFGPNSNLPKKRMARVDKEITDAGKYLVKGR
uniref:Photosystem II Psb27 protein n=1 Tax=Lotharella globosa TaxID=91324 RepID=A0A6U2XFH8_9EUKA